MIVLLTQKYFPKTVIEKIVHQLVFDGDKKQKA
jgi:hypothetical protein